MQKADLRQVLKTGKSKNSRLLREGQVCYNNEKLCSGQMPKPSQHMDQLSKFLAYMLGRRPDEFGMVPDTNGYVRVKELLQALHEEQGWRHVRQAHLNEALVVPENPAFEIEGSRIRAVDRSRLPVAAPSEDLPKLLYIAIRSRAYPVALERGLAAMPGQHLILSTDMDMAMRMGRRLDNNPTLLTVQMQTSIKSGTCFQKYGRVLFLADTIHPGTFSGPALPKVKSVVSTSVIDTAAQQTKTPGSYFPEIDAPQSTRHRPYGSSRQKEPQWKKDRRQARKHKTNLR
jgi:putative RNA 2'-phosphotransferase